jgi:hypothetical protein
LKLIARGDAKSLAASAALPATVDDLRRARLPDELVALLQGFIAAGGYDEATVVRAFLETLGAMLADGSIKVRFSRQFARASPSVRKPGRVRRSSRSGAGTCTRRDKSTVRGSARLVGQRLKATAANRPRRSPVAERITTSLRGCPAWPAVRCHDRSGGG